MVTRADLGGRHVLHREVDVVGEIGHVPIVGRRVGHHAERRVMHLQRAVDRLDHERLAGLVLEEEMRAGDRALRAAEAGRRRRHEHDVLHRLSHLIDRGEIGERPDAEFLRRERVARVLLASRRHIWRSPGNRTGRRERP